LFGFDKLSLTNAAEQNKNCQPEKNTVSLSLSKAVCRKVPTNTLRLKLNKKQKVQVSDTTMLNNEQMLVTKKLKLYGYIYL